MTIESKVKKYLARIKKDNKKINAFLEVRPAGEVLKEARELDKKKKKGKLYGCVFGVKSNINVLGMTVSCASKTLEDYKASYNATVIEKIRKEDGLIIGMTNLDEFAAGSSGENSAFGATVNPRVKGHVAGGSSSGSAAAVAAGMCDVSLGSDTGGSIRVPASFCGVVGVKPSYGAVSRYGLVDLSMSLDQIGPLGRSVEDVSRVLDVISGKDERDTKTFELGGVKLGGRGKIKVGVVKIQGVNSKIQEVVDKKIEEVVGKLKWESQNVEIKHVDLALQVYHLLVWTEFFSATRRFDGRKYGKKIEDVCGEEVLRRILGGREVTKAEFAGRYYHKALDVKEIIKKSCEDVLKKVDCIIMPTTPVFPWKIGSDMSWEAVYATDALVIPANLAGLCAVSLPVGKVDGMPVGMQVICGNGEDGKMLSISKEIEKLG
jgi:aspartyl-tRNA(Asn)/glutamyl-tRNA(Gln) amidotransferase subunit A